MRHSTATIDNFSWRRSVVVARLVVATIGLLALSPALGHAAGADVDEAIQRADTAQASARKAAEREDYATAVAETRKAVTTLERLAAEVEDGEQKAMLHDLIGSESNRGIMFCYLGVDKSDISEGISGAWRDRIEALARPQKVKDDNDLVTLDWKVYFAYGSLQQHLADFYIRKGDYSRANWRFAAAETYLEKYDEAAPDDVLADPEQQEWRQLNKKRLNELIAGKGITEGMYVQNDGLLQKWVGRVISVDGNTITVRMTHVSDFAPRGFVAGRNTTFLRDEIKPVRSLSLDALLHPYR